MRRFRFTFVCSQEERKLISALAHHLNRSQGDALRFLVSAAARELNIDSTTISRASTKRTVEQNEK